MLIGKNKIEMNQATMMRAVQHYFDTVLFKDGKAPKVTKIERATSASTFNADAFTVETDEMPDKPA